MQVHPNAIHHIRADGRINECKTPGKRTIVRVGCNRMQVVIALIGGELMYFEMDITCQLMEIEKREISGDVACLDIAPVLEGRQRSRILAVGSYDSAIRILSLHLDDCMQILSVQGVPSPPESLLLLKVQASTGGEDGAESRVDEHTIRSETRSSSPNLKAVRLLFENKSMPCAYLYSRGAVSLYSFLSWDGKLVLEMSLTANKWTRANEMFMISNVDMLAIGGDHYSILISSDLLTGYRDSCETFGSPQLARFRARIFAHVNKEEFSAPFAAQRNSTYYQSSCGDSSTKESGHGDG